MSMDIDEPGTPPPGLAPWSAPFGPAVGTGGLPLTGENSSKKKKTTRCIIDNPTLDLDVYIANYSGHAKIERLIFIADRCPPLAADALKLALIELKQTMNAVKYHAVLQKLNEVLAGHNQPSVPLDTTWYEATQKAARSTADKLELELKTYKNNLIKESIRMGHNELGDHFYNVGDLGNALKSYSRTRDYCTTPKHIVDMCLNVIKVSIELGNFTHVQSYVVKAESAPELPEKGVVSGKLNCAMGLVEMEAGKFKKAANFFLATPFEMGTNYSEVISANDVAVYGGLCALASYDRSELKTKVFENSEFKQYLELEPQVRELLHSFYNSKYGKCLELLAASKNDFLLDFYLHSHVDLIYQNIRKKALVQYFSPFLSVDMHRMAAAFNTSVLELEMEVANLITENQIKGRIDSHNKVLKVRHADQRSTIFEKSLATGADYQKQVKFMLLRMKLVRADLIVKLPHELRDQ